MSKLCVSVLGECGGGVLDFFFFLSLVRLCSTVWQSVMHSSLSRDAPVPHTDTFPSLSAFKSLVSALQQLTSQRGAEHGGGEESSMEIR